MKLRISLLLSIALLGTFLGAVRVSYAELGESNDVRIYVVNNGWHTGIVLPITALKQALPFILEDFEGAKYLEIGWGDYDFYQAEDESLGFALKALFWPTESVVHIMGFHSDPMAYFSHIEIIPLTVSMKGVTELSEFIKQSLNFKGLDRPEKLRRGLYGNSFFYDGNGRFSITNTCNTWTAQALERSGLEIDGLGIVTADGVVAKIKQLHGVISQEQSISE